MSEVKWGWVPNTLGDSLTKEYIKEKIDEFNASHSPAGTGDPLNGYHMAPRSKTRDDWVFKYSFVDGDAWNIKASCDWGTSQIAVRDNGGICSITMGDGMDLYEDKLWNEFRKILDGCSDTPADCTAMKKLVAVNEKSIEESIAYAFIDAMEKSSDSGNHVFRKNPAKVLGWARQTDASMRACNIPLSNQLYFERFLQIYDEQLHAAKTKLEMVMKVRYEKARVVTDYNVRDSEFRFKKCSLMYTRISWIIASIAIIVAVAIGLR